MERNHVKGEHGLLVPILRQAWRLRHHPRFGHEMRRDIKHCVRCLRHNRKIEDGKSN